MWALWSVLRPEAQQPACRPAVSGGIKGIIIQLLGNTRTRTHTLSHAHTGQTNHYVAHLQVDYQIDTTVHIVEIRPFFYMVLFN